jgi:pSer/pThr/pTyr-binding forkhead associated (FHA) protein
MGMSTHFARTPRQQQLGAATAQLEVTPPEPTLDAFRLLDHRTRTRANPSLGQAPRGHYLEVEDRGSRRYVPLDRSITHIGRGFTADLRLEQPHVSVSHAILVRHGRHMRVLDNRSSNGTFVNGRRVVATNLEHGDVVRVGPVEMRYIVVS